jgi:LysR family transcriptional regulator, nitrogen assimilation regulatory protein
MDLRQIQYFMALYEEESITKAAKRLHVVQPAVSMQLRRLESDYGVILFDRTPQGISPNAIAREMYPLCREALQNAGRLRDLLRAASGKLVEDLSIGVPPTLASGVLGPLLVAFHEKNPCVRLRIREGYSANMLEWLIQGDLDLAFVIMADVDRRLHYRTLATEDLVVAIGRDTVWEPEEIEGSDLAAFKLIVPSARNSVRVMIEASFTQAGLTLHPAMEVDSLVTIFSMLRAPNWASVLPRSAVVGEGQRKHLRAVRLVKPSVQRSLTVASQSHRALSPAARLFIDQLEASLNAL